LIGYVFPKFLFVLYLGLRTVTIVTTEKTRKNPKIFLATDATLKSLQESLIHPPLQLLDT